MHRATAFPLIGAAVFLLAYPSRTHAQQIDPSWYSQLEYRHIGPVGNRVISVAGIPGDPTVYYAGAASGGIFKTTDGGTHWEPIFDDQPVASIGALAVAPSDRNIVWAGTGESFIRSHISLGAGIYKSTDAGKTWTLMGLEKTGRIGRIVIDPRNPDVVFAAAEGHSYGPQQERGVFRTKDGGATWERVLFVDENTGAADIAMDPNNPRILFAGMWQIVIHTWGRESGGPGSGIFMSRDGGDTWNRLSGHGLPQLPVGKIALAVAPSNSERVYALIETGDGVPWHGQETENGELWRSDDGGDNWRLVSYDRNLAGRTAYYTRVLVSPDDDMEAYFLSASFNKTIDGGATTITASRGNRPGGDNHDMWIDPTDADRMIVGNDGGVGISINHGRSWNRIQLPIAQMYHVTVDNRVPYYVYGNRQDGPSARGPSRTFFGGFGGAAGRIPRGEWFSVGGGESGWATPDPQDPNIVWSSASGSGAVGGIVTRFDLRTMQVQNVEVWPKSTIGWPAADLKYRFVWTPPLTISPHDHNKVYTGSQYVHVTTDGGQSWQVISPDLTLNDKSKQGISGGLTPDNIGVEYAGVVFAIAESPVQAGVIWAGTNDGLVHVTRDGGGTWTDVTKNIKNLPPWGTISNIEPSRYDVATAYMAVDFHQANGRDPHIYRTNDFGKSWKLITSGIPKSPLSYTHVVREDPVRRGLLYAGTENALYVSFNDGDNWQPLQTNLPHAPVYWLTVQEQFNDLVVATYGRGFWILDDITPLQQFTDDVALADAHLFKPRAAYRFRGTVAPFAASSDPSAGTNPPYGASLNYYLKSESDGDAEIEIVDGAGNTVRTMKGSTDVGINRVWWDLRYDGSTEVKLRTSPLYASDIKVGEQGWRAAPGVGRLSVLVPPGAYTVNLNINGREYSQPLTIKKDPHSGGTEVDIAAQTKVMVDLRDDVNSVAEMINTVESVRSQLYSLEGVLAAAENDSAVRTTTEEFDKKLIAFEENLYQLRQTGRGQDGVRWPAKLMRQLTYLAGRVSSSDFAPTTQQLEVKELLHNDVLTYRAEFERLLQDDLTAFNDALARQGIQGIVVKRPRAASDRD
ncbi:MAG: WD40/YVTN/BNR-like repeat-containing protein [Gemmatimonadales bacterium]